MYLSSTDKIQVVLGGTITTNQLPCVASWQDITSAGMTLPQLSSQINTNNTSEVDLVAAPAASTNRQVVYLTVYNNDTVAATVTVIKDVSATNWILAKVTLQSGDTLQWSREGGWNTFPNNTTTEAAGNDTEIQFNDGGVVGADSDLTYDKTTNTLSLNGTDPKLNLTGIATEPSTPASGILTLYSKNISGRMLPKWRGPSGLDTPFQPALFGKNVVMWNPGATSGVATGTVVTAIAAGVATLPTTTNLYTALRRSVFTVATGINLQNSLRTESMFFRGASANQGGFFAFCRFGFTTWTATNRCFVGFTVGTTAVTTGNPSALLNIAGFGIDTADTAFTFMHNDGAGTAVKEAIAGQPALATNNAYDVYIFCPPNSSEIYYRMDNLLTQTTLVNTSINSEMPVNTTMLNFHVAIGSGATNAGAGVAAIGLNRIYVETDC